MNPTPPSPRKQLDTSQMSKSTMPREVAPRQTPQKKQISQKEYNLREEWAPETIEDYQVSSGKPAPVTMHQQGHKQQPQSSKPQLQPQPQTTSHSIVQGRMPNRRSQVRSSSLFEEWKAKALRNPVQPNGPVVSPTSTPIRNGRTGGGITSSNAREPLTEKFDKSDDDPAKTKLAKDSRGRQPATTKADYVNTVFSNIPGSLPFPNIQGESSINPTATIRKGGRKQGGPQRQQQHSRDRGQEQQAYVAPNGTRFDTDELTKLALGVRPGGKDMVYFLPCFIEYPWKDIKPSPYIRLADLKNRF